MADAIETHSGAHGGQRSTTGGPLVDVDEVATQLGLTQRATKRWIATRAYRRKIGRHWMLPRWQYEADLERES